jgi:AcrR family transcriptional regulator
MVSDPAEGSAPRQRRTLGRYQRSQKTRERITVAAVQLFREVGYEGVTIDEICDAAGVSRSGFYFHFATKEELLFEMDLISARRARQEVEAQARLPGTSLDAELDVLLRGLARRARRVPRDLLARALTRATQSLPYVGQGPHPDADFGRVLGQVFRRAQVRSELSSEDDPDEMAAVLAAMFIEGMLRWAYGTTPSPDLEEALRWRADLFLEGARHRHSR